jgi:2-C-methyl-D-erythritol 2,4-cyclodiphosphate synthase
MIRIGHGYDVHAFGGNKPLVLGGVSIPNHIGLLAHSDGDVLLHAVCDALLGAAGFGDIGKHFPDNDERYANIDSSKLLSEVVELIRKEGYKVANIDVSVVAETPRMSPHIQMMISKLAELLLVEEGQVNVKATTTEKLGYIGRKEGIAVHCVCLISKY